MVSKRWENASYLCFYIGIILLIFGLSLYLQGPKEKGSLTFECAYDIDGNYEIEQNYQFYDFSCRGYPIEYYFRFYTKFTSNLVLSRDIIITNKNINETFYLYIVNSTEYYSLKNRNYLEFKQWIDNEHLTSSEEIIELNKSRYNITYKIYDNSAYHVIVFKNYIDSAEKQIPFISVLEILTVKRLEFNKVWIGLIIGFVGSLLILVALFFKNPIDGIIIKVCKITKFLYSMNYKEYKDFYENKRIFLWKWLLISSYLLFILLYIIINHGILIGHPISDIKLLLLDLSIHKFIYIYYADLLFVLLFIIFVEIAQPIFSDILYWLTKKRNIIYDVNFEKIKYKKTLHKLISFPNLIIYLIIGILIFLNIYIELFNLNHILFYLIPIIILVSYNLIISFKETCEYHRINYEIESKKFKKDIIKVTMIGLWMLFAMLFSWSISVIVLNNYIYDLTVASSAAFKYLTELDINNGRDTYVSFAYQILSKKTISYFIFIEVFFCYCCINGINYSTIQPSMRKIEIIHNIKGMMIFILSFMSIQIIYFASTLDTSDLKNTLTTSIFASLISYYFMYSYRELFS